MAVTAGLVKELRELTGAGMLECKKALTETDGNVEKAIDLLREKGLAAAQKKAGRIASEGLVYCYLSDDNNTGSIVEVNSETDFVAKNDDFKNFVNQVAKQASLTNSTDLDSFLNDKWELDNNITVKEALTQKIAVIGENLNIRRFVKYTKSKPGSIVSYIHGGGKISVLIEITCDISSDKLVEAGKNVCMQIAALNPYFISRDDVPSDFIEKEREILKQQALNEGKPANIVDKMVEGRLEKELQEFCLLEQKYVKDSDLTVAKYLSNVASEIGSPISIVRFERFETGEGLQKKQEDFAEEVSKAING